MTTVLWPDGFDARCPDPVAVIGMPDAVYRADPCETPSLSSSVAKTIVERSALHAKMTHPRFGGAPRTSEEMDRGALIHGLVNGGGAGYAVIDADDFRTKAAREARDAARAAGKIPVIASKLEPLLAAADQIRARLSLIGISLSPDHSEVSVFWREPSEAGEVLCRGRLDNWPGGATIYDLKTTENAAPDAVERSIARFGYDIQVGAYISAIEHLKPELRGRVRFEWIFAEYEPPYSVTRFVAAPSLEEIGRRRWSRAVSTWAECLRTGKWPEYGTQVRHIEAAGWLMMREELAA